MPCSTVKTTKIATRVFDVVFVQKCRFKISSRSFDFRNFECSLAGILILNWCQQEKVTVMDVTHVHQTLYWCNKCIPKIFVKCSLRFVEAICERTYFLPSLAWFKRAIGLSGLCVSDSHTSAVPRNRRRPSDHGVVVSGHNPLISPLVEGDFSTRKILSVSVGSDVLLGKQM